MLGEPLRDGLPVGAVALHPHGERLRAAQNEPRVERAGHAARGVLQIREPLAQGGVIAGDRAAYDIRVAADVLRRRVQDEIRAVRQRVL